jgi:ATP synthase in type III secretion protein N
MSDHQSAQDRWRRSIDAEANSTLIDCAESFRAPRLASVWRPELRGTVVEAVGTTLRVIGLSLGVGDLCEIELEEGAVLLAETVGISGKVAMLMPYGELAGIKAGAWVKKKGRGHRIAVGPALLGRVIDGFGRPLDGFGDYETEAEVPLSRPPPPAMERQLVQHPVSVGVRIIDALMTVGLGQRFGIFAPAGVGKTTLLGMLARHAQFDVNVIALIGERGRELREFIEDSLGDEGLARSVVVVATSDSPAMARAKAAQLSTAIAEYFRDELGQRVLLIMDSATRYARALREIGLASGEPPTRRGYPPSVFAELPRLMERSGNGAVGTMTAFYTVLMEDEETADPIAEEIRSILDGHLVLSRKLAAAGQYPAIDPRVSLSRVMSRVTDPAHQQAAERVRSWIAKYDEVELLLQVGEYRAGNDPTTDLAIERHEQITEFLHQAVDEHMSAQDSIDWLHNLAAV